MPLLSPLRSQAPFLGRGWRAAPGVAGGAVRRRRGLSQKSTNLICNDVTYPLKTLFNVNISKAHDLYAKKLKEIGSGLIILHCFMLKVLRAIQFDSKFHRSAVEIKNVATHNALSSKARPEITQILIPQSILLFCRVSSEFLRPLRQRGIIWPIWHKRYSTSVNLA